MCEWLLLDTGNNHCSLKLTNISSMITESKFLVKCSCIPLVGSSGGIPWGDCLGVQWASTVSTSYSFLAVETSPQPGQQYGEEQGPGSYALLHRVVHEHLLSVSQHPMLSFSCSLIFSSLSSILFPQVAAVWFGAESMGHVLL